MTVKEEPEVVPHVTVTNKNKEVLKADVVIPIRSSGTSKVSKIMPMNTFGTLDAEKLKDFITKNVALDSEVGPATSGLDERLSTKVTSVVKKTSDKVQLDDRADSLADTVMNNMETAIHLSPSDEVPAGTFGVTIVQNSTFNEPSVNTVKVFGSPKIETIIHLPGSPPALGSITTPDRASLPEQIGDLVKAMSKPLTEENVGEEEDESENQVGIPLVIRPEDTEDKISELMQNSVDAGIKAVTKNPHKDKETDLKIIKITIETNRTVSHPSMTVLKTNEDLEADIKLPGTRDKSMTKEISVQSDTTR